MALVRGYDELALLLLNCAAGAEFAAVVQPSSIAAASDKSAHRQTGYPLPALSGYHLTRRTVPGIFAGQSDAADVLVL